MIEYFDVVDEDDQIIDRQTRDFVHKQGLLHRSVHALVFNSQGHIYLQKRSMNKDTNPGLWDCSMSGHVTSGETYIQALYREIQEELGINLIELPGSLFKLRPSEATGNEFSWVYNVLFNGEIVPCEIEVETGHWVSMKELKSWIGEAPNQFTSSLLLILDAYLSDSDNNSAEPVNK